MAKPALKVVTPSTVNRTVGPVRRPSAELRTREYLTGAEVCALMDAERTLIRARTGEGRERAKARGVRFGRPKKLSARQRREAIDRIAAGEAVAEVARTFGIDRATGIA